MANNASSIDEYHLAQIKKGSNRIYGVLFYAPWCPHSKQVLPIWDKLSNIPATFERDIHLSKIDCTQEKEVYYKEAIKIYPTMKFYFYGLPLTYEGEKDYDSLLKYLNFLDYDNLHDVNSLEEYVEFKSKHLKSIKPILLGFFSDSSPLSLYFVYACKLYDWITCAISDNENFAHDMKTHMDSVSLVRDFKFQNDIEYFDQQEFDLFTQWINFHAYPKITPFSENYKIMMFDRKRLGVENHILFFIDFTLDTTEPFILTLQKLWDKYKTLCLFISIDINDESEFLLDNLNSLGFDINNHPPALILSSKNNQIHSFNFDPNVSLNKDTISSWLESFFKGELIGSSLNMRPSDNR